MSEAEGVLAAMRAEGVHQMDPVRFRYLEALASRIQNQPAAVRQVLASRFDEAVLAYRAKLVCGVHPAPPVPHSPASSAGARLWSQFLADMAQRAQAGCDGDDAEAGMGSPSDMKSVRRFAATWSKIATERQLSAALTRGPGHAGPLNSHNLMLRTMSLMHALSPAYLRRFMAQADALVWLDQMNQQLVLKSGKAPARRARTKK